MTTATATNPTYRIMALEDAPKGTARGGRGRVGIFVQALLALDVNMVAEFAPCPAKHFGVRKQACSASRVLNGYRQRHPDLKARTWHVGGNLYIAKLA